MIDRAGRTACSQDAEESCRPDAVSTATPGDSMQFTHEHDEIRRTLKRFIADEINPHVDAVGSGRAVPGARGLQEARRPRPARPDQAEPRAAAWRLDYSYSVRDGRGARRHRLRRRADGDRRADRHGDARPRPLRLATSCGAITSRRRSPATRSPASASASPAPAPTSPAIRRRARKDGGDYVINGAKMWITNSLQADWMCLLANTVGGRGAQEQEPDHRADGHARASRRRRRSARSA